MLIGQRKLLLEQVPKVIRAIKEIGFVISPKSVLIPTDSIDFIGFDINKYTVCIKESTIDKVLLQLSNILEDCSLSSLIKYITPNINRSIVLENIHSLNEIVRDSQYRKGIYKCELGKYLSILETMNFCSHTLSDWYCQGFMALFHMLQIKASGNE